MKPIVNTYEEAVHYIEEIPKFTKKTTLRHTRNLLEVLGNPDRGMKIIHVAGTNGKGSVCSFLNAMFMEGGYKCGLFTSPHLIRINERFLINKEEVSDEEFLEAFQTVMRAASICMAAGEEHPTYFETLFLMGMVLFRKHQVDYLILETGLGGRLDATNVIDSPLACILVSISRDHTEYLGETIREIALEKAGIIKQGVPVIYDAHNTEAAEIFAARAKELGCMSYAMTDDKYALKESGRDGIRFTFYGEEEPVTLEIASVAEYQMMNASLAFFTMEQLRSEHGIARDVLIRGLSKMKWPCRMETVMEGVVIDGAHNEDGIARFIQTAGRFRKTGEVTLLFSAVCDKEYEEMIREISEGIRPDRVVVTRVSGSREIPEEELAALFRRFGIEQVEAVRDVGPAFERAYALKGDGMLFCVGSLYLAGEIKDWIRKRK